MTKLSPIMVEQRKRVIDDWLETSSADKNVLSVSLGSSKRDSKAEVEMLGIKVGIFRFGCDGNPQLGKSILESFDGDSRISAYGLGGIDLWSGKKKYLSKRAEILIKNVRKTPFFDGWGLKDTLERRAILYLREIFPIDKKKVFLVSGVDRFGMAEELEKCGCKMIYGDFMFTLNLPIPLRSLRILNLMAGIFLKFGSYFPVRTNYPIGDEQEVNTPKFQPFFEKSDFIVGDFIYIKRYMPKNLKGKIIITNTTTEEDVNILDSRGASYLITTTPRINGRTFGTNVMEAVFASVLKERDNMSNYNDLLDEMNYKPEILKLGL
jgi:hypothetical protein